VKGRDLYAIVMKKNADTREIAIQSLRKGGAPGSVRSVSLLGGGAALSYKQDATGLTVTLPDLSEHKGAFVLKITGVKTNPDTNTASGNPVCECRLAQ
jgi:alpha-L-fucosidase